jgi:hypothetical protein
VEVYYLILLRKRSGRGEKLNGVGFLRVNNAFLFEGGGERGLGFFFCYFFQLLKGEEGMVFFSRFKKKFLKVGRGWGRGFLLFSIFCYPFIIWKFFVILFILERGRGA